MGLFSKLFGSKSKDYSDGVICPVCGSKCYWDDEEWVCDSCGYVPDAGALEYDSETDTVNAFDIDWYCDECDAISTLNEVSIRMLILGYAKNAVVRMICRKTIF